MRIANAATATSTPAVARTAVARARNVVLTRRPPYARARSGIAVPTVYASVIATACPYCAIMMSDGTKALPEAGAIATRDIAELVEASLDAATIQDRAVALPRSTCC